MLQYIVRITAIVILLVHAYGCRQQDKVSSSSPGAYSFDVTNLTDAAYPDNPDIGHRAEDYVSAYFESGRLEVRDSVAGYYFMKFKSQNGQTITLDSVYLLGYLPTIPQQVRGSAYLSHIACVNQEWNRNQVTYRGRHFSASDERIVRVDLARNCLSAYLWEVIPYVEEDGKEVPYAHGWFEFPHDLYASLFTRQNGVPFDTYAASLEAWIDPVSRPVDLTMLRRILKTYDITATDRSDTMYPLSGARAKKRKEIVYPVTLTSMRDLQSDSTTFATFAPPGKYDRSDPRRTELGRFRQLEEVALSLAEGPMGQDTFHELTLRYTDVARARVTQFVLGGLNFDDLPVLLPERANEGWKWSMGIGNHSFYETYEQYLGHDTGTSPYYGLLLDDKGKWLDSHGVGIDGPILHFEDETRTRLHLWLLSFERHALVGHYVIDLHGMH